MNDPEDTYQPEPGRWLHIERYGDRLALVVRNVGGCTYERAYVVEHGDLSRLLVKNSGSIEAELLDLVADPDWPKRQDRAKQAARLKETGDG